MTAALDTRLPDAVRWAILRQVGRDFGRVYPDRRDDTWILSWSIDGRRYQTRHLPVEGSWIPVPDEETGQIVLEAVRAEVRGGTPKLAAIAPYLRSQAPELRFRACWGRFVEAKRRQGSHGGRQLSRARLAELEGHERRGHLAPLLDLPAHHIGYATLEEWRDGLFAQGLAPGSVHHVVADVGTCLRWLARRQEIPRVPELPTVRIPQHAARIPSPDEIRQLLASIPWGVRGQWLARSQLGLRPSEAQRASVADWRFEPETHRLPDGSEIAAHTLTVRGKGERVRMLPVPAEFELVAWIAEHREPKLALQGEAAPLFPNPRAQRARNREGRWTKASSRRVWLAACRELGWMLSPHKPRYEENVAMRHAFATHHAMGDLLRLSEFLGHSDPRTTRRYRQMAAGALVEVVRK